ncbi:MAG: amidohydrolase family protein [Gemmatimonadaceae bacterium]
MLLRSLRATAAAAALVLPVALAAQAPAGSDSAPTKPGLPLKSARSLAFTTDQGTWISLDVSPDGKAIVFDLLGHLYTLPIAGGKATRLTEGMGFDSQPRYSPDGRTILFVSDRSGGENLWLMDVDGRHPRALTKGDKGQYISPVWTPDGSSVVVSKNAAGVLGSTYDLVLIHKDGGTGVKLTGLEGAATPPPPPNAPPPFNNFLGAAFGKDPRYIYVAVKRGGFGYNLQLPQWQVSVYDRETGKLYSRTGNYGSSMRPVVSRDGTRLVYATRYDSVTALRLRDLATGDERWLATDVQRDDQESRFTRDLMPGFAFTPDGSALVLAHHGKIWRLDAQTGKQTPIPFTADIHQDLGPLVRFEYRINDSTLTVHQIRGARPSPDGRRLAFTALDRLWIMDFPKGRPHRVTSNSVGEHDAAWSPDGRYLAYATWSAEGGDIYRIRTDGQRAPERLTSEKAFYRNLAYTPDGTRLVAARGPREQQLEHAEETEDPPVSGMELVWLPASGAARGAPRRIAPVGYVSQPHFTRDTSRIYVYDPVDGVVSMRFDGTDRMTHLRVTGFVQPLEPKPFPQPAREVMVSPTGDRAVAQVNNNLYLLSVPFAGGPTAPTVSVLQPATAAVPVRRVTRIGGEFLGWMPDGKSLYYSIGHSFFRYDISAADSLIRDSTEKADSLKSEGRGEKRGAPTVGDTSKTPKADSAKAGAKAGQAVALAPADSARVAKTDTARKARTAYEPMRVDVLITVPRDRPVGLVALTGGRLITMKGEDVIEKGTVLVRGNRIVAAGPTASVDIPAGTKVVDVTGKTVLPGWVDVHAHMWLTWGVHRAEAWQYLANLAYGVTTTRDPQTSTTDVLSYGDLVETGDILGPRIFSTGPGVFSSDDITSLDDARDVLRRYADFYDTKTIKQYMVGNRKVRQWVIMAARELGLMPTSEGGLDFKKNLTEAIDGYPGHEHSYPIVPLAEDVVHLLAFSGITYTPTLIVQYGGPWAENYWYEHSDVHADPKLRRFIPHANIDRRSLRRPGWFRDDQYSFPLIAAQAAKIEAAGGKVGLGGHGQLQGLGVHWELWSIASGGMPVHDVLRVGTLNGAQAIGLEKDLGSLEAGKLADLQVLDANPLENIRNTTSVRLVMKNGRLYDASTLAELWPRQRELSTPWWLGRDPTR